MNSSNGARRENTQKQGLLCVCPINTPQNTNKLIFYIAMKKLIFKILPAVILLIGAFIVLGGCEKKQTKVGLNDDLNGMSWTTMYYGLGSYNKVCGVTTKYYFIDGDSIVGNTAYKKLYYYKDEQHAERFYEGLMRKDESKWYFVPQGKNQEYLMYDFNITEGSTFEGKYVKEEETYKYYVRQVDNSNILGREVKRIRFSYSATDDSNTDTWYDNIGSTKGLLNTIYAQNSGADKVLLCVHKNAEIIYKNVLFDKCYYGNDDIEEVDEIINPKK